MPAQAGENGAVRVSPMDQRGRPISPPVLSAAEEVSRRAIHHAEKLLVDPAVAANLLEEAAATVSRALTAKNTHQPPVQDLESYLFRAFLRRLSGSSWKEVGRAYRISSHAAESKFSQALHKVRKKLRLK